MGLLISFVAATILTFTPISSVANGDAHNDFSGNLTNIEHQINE